MLASFLSLRVQGHPDLVNVGFGGPQSPAEIPGAKKPAYLVLEVCKSEPRVHQELRLEPPNAYLGPPVIQWVLLSLCPSNRPAPGTPEGGK